MAASASLTQVIPNAPVVVEWSDISCQPRVPHYLADPDPSSVQLNLLFDKEQGTVSLKIRVMLHFEKESGDIREFVYIPIHPTNVHLLLKCPACDLPNGITTAVRGPTVQFRLVLDKPISIVASSNAPEPLRSERDQRLLDSLELLRQQTFLSIYVGERNISDPGVLQRICDAFTGGSIKQNPRHDSLQDYYRGFGAGAVQNIVTSATLAGQAEIDDHAASPPPYPEGAQPPPSSPFPQVLPQKRRRRSPEDLGTSSTSTHRPDIGNMCAEHFAQQKDSMSEFFLWQQAQVTKFFDQQEARMEPIAARVDRELQGLEGRLIKRLKEHVHKELDDANEG